MSTPDRNPRDAMSAQVTALAWHAIRTTPGLILITLGSLAAGLGYPWWGLAVAAAGAIVYAEQCKRTPYAPCARCAGTGHHRAHPARVCRLCRGKGVRMRWGRAVMNTCRRATYSTGQAPAAPGARPLTPGTYAQALRDNDDTHRADRHADRHRDGS